MSKRLLAVAVTAVVVALGLPRGASAAVGVTINCELTNGVTILFPGNYRLKKSVHDCGASTLIKVNADDVVLDLDSHTADGNDACNRGVYSIGARTVIKNGKVSGCGTGVDLGSSSMPTVSGITVSDTESTGIWARDGRIHHSTVKHVGATGIYAGITTVDHNMIKDVVGGIVGNGGIIHHNTVANAGGVGIDATAQPTEVFANTVRDSVTDAIVGDGCRCHDNVIDHVGGRGIYNPNGRTEHNDIRAASDVGVSDGLVISHNTVTNTNGFGIQARDETTTVEDNVVNGSGSYGILILTPGHIDIVRNVSNGNSSHGIMVLDVDGPTTRIAENTANGNGLQGIDVEDTSVPHDSVGTNHAKHNAAEPQCDLNLCA